MAGYCCLGVVRTLMPEKELAGALIAKVQESTLATWVFLALAIAFEVSGTTSMKLSEGFSKLVPSVLMLVLPAESFFITLALKKIDVGVAYAVWAGVGTALIACVGILWFKEPLTALKIISIGLIIAGVAGLNLGGNMH